MKKYLCHSTSTQITDQQEILAELVTNIHFEQQPDLEIKYGKAGKKMFKEDSYFHLSYLAEAIRIERIEIFTDYLKWAQVMMQSRDIPHQDLVRNLAFLDQACKQILPPDNYSTARDYINKGTESLKNQTADTASFLTTDNPLLPYAKEYLSLLLKANRKDAQALIDKLLKDGHSLTDIYEYIFAATQYEVGVLWQSNKITVAHEHYCTAATQFIMSTLYPLIFNAEKKPYKMMGCTVSGSLHELGIRMISDFFEKDGWNTYYMGANLPNKDIIAAIKEQKVDVLAISISMSFDISKVETLIKNIRSDETLNDLKIIVGGHPFNQIQGLWKLVGADGWAKNARETVELSNQMMSNLNSAK